YGNLAVPGDARGARLRTAWTYPSRRSWVAPGLAVDSFGTVSLTERYQHATPALRDGGTTADRDRYAKRGSAGPRLGQMSRFVTRKTVQNRSRRLPSAPPGAEADVARQNDGLCTRLDAELAEHGGHVIACRAFADAEPRAD